VKKKQLKKLVAKTADKAADKAAKADFYTQAVKAAKRHAKKSAEAAYRFQRRDPVTGEYPVDGKIEYQRPGPFLGDQKPFPPLSGEREDERDWGVAR
jgi:hypothetical protein